jgi:SEC-C motif-containing protein
MRRPAFVQAALARGSCRWSGHRRVPRWRTRGAGSNEADFADNGAMPGKSTTTCPCGSGRGFDACCGPALAGAAVATTAEALMRSRYCAYVLGERDYLLASWHPSTRPATLEPDPAVRWLGLSVKRHEQTAPDAAVVEFVARHRIGGGPAARLHEVSRFVREDGCWYYLDGDFPAP